MDKKPIRLFSRHRKLECILPPPPPSPPPVVFTPPVTNYMLVYSTLLCIKARAPGARNKSTKLGGGQNRIDPKIHRKCYEKLQKSKNDIKNFTKINAKSKCSFE